MASENEGDVLSRRRVSESRSVCRDCGARIAVHFGQSPFPIEGQVHRAPPRVSIMGAGGKAVRKRASVLIQSTALEIRIAADSTP